MTDALDLRLVRPSTFEPLVGTEFAGEDPDVRFTLVGVNRLGIQPDAPRAEPFALTFLGPPGLEQRIYALSYASLGRLHIFLVPIGLGPDGTVRYEAVFN